MMRAFRTLLGCRRGVTAVEYGLILAFVCIAVIAIISAVGGKTLVMWTNMSTKIPVVQS